jgi:hypothetical protein
LLELALLVCSSTSLKARSRLPLKLSNFIALPKRTILAGRSFFVFRGVLQGY